MSVFENEKWNDQKGRGRGGEGKDEGEMGLGHHNNNDATGATTYPKVHIIYG